LLDYLPTDLDVWQILDRAVVKQGARFKPTNSNSQTGNWHISDVFLGMEQLLEK